jgi:hypothetical protein
MQCSDAYMNHAFGSSRKQEIGRDLGKIVILRLFPADEHHSDFS